MYSPHHEYTCHICHRRFKLERYQKLSCTVPHPDGTCCHHFETEIRPEDDKQQELPFAMIPVYVFA